jgi:hypothetical protein
MTAIKQSPARAVEARLVMWRDEDSGTPCHLFFELSSCSFGS